MFRDLGKLIIAIQENYERICDMWSAMNTDSINLKKKQVIDMLSDQNLFESIFQYRSLINDEFIRILFNLNVIQYEKSSVTSRVKAQNSIEFKIDNYITTHEGGKIPLKKCMNDLLGLRIVINEDFSFDDIKQYMDVNFPQYKCIDSTKPKENPTYIATHVYFEKGNLFFPWELQVWTKKNEKGNLASHKEYKQDYTRWEVENKGGVEGD